MADLAPSLSTLRFAVVGAFVPTCELLALARAADELGYNALCLGDHVVDLSTLETPYPYSSSGTRRWDPDAEWPDPWVAIAAMAAVTERLEFFTSVYVPAMRSPFQVAKSIGTAAALSGGRVRLGAGVGWCREEFELLRSDFATRGARTDEMLALIRQLWTHDWVEFEGHFHPTPRLTIRPRPPAPVPILIGGLSDVALRRAARFDGWVGDFCSTDAAIRVAARLRELRPLDAPAPHVIAALNDAVTPEQFAAAHAGGVSEVMTQPWHVYYGRRATLAQKIDSLHRFRDDVIEPLTALSVQGPGE